MASPGTLKGHPRLYASEKALGRLKRPLKLPVLRAAAREVSRAAREYLRTKPAQPPDSHNWCLRYARQVQTRVVTLLVEWFRTGDDRYRVCALQHVRELGAREYWSWIALRRGDPAPNAIFDLSYGENSATIAVAYDWLYDTLSGPERRELVSVAKRRSLVPFLKWTRRCGLSHWFCAPKSNWNTVCAGGAGMLALAMYEDLPEARKALPRTERSIVPFMRQLKKTSGGWPEGIGYWNYGMSYAFMYLLSHERATGRRHPLMRQPATAETLGFPLDFTPNGVPCSFGDVNRWSPRPFHFAAAERLGRRDVLARLDAALAARRADDRGRPDAAELLLLHPRRRTKPPGPKRRVVKLYPKFGWGVIADRMPNPRLYMSVRGGEFERHHGHLDLMSFFCVVADEAVFANVPVSEYLDTTFSPRRYDLFEMRPDSKNSLLVNGVGPVLDSKTKPSVLKMPGVAGIRVDGTEAMGRMRDGPAARFCGRAFMLLGERAMLVIDRVETTKHVARVESRAHTPCSARAGAASADLRGKKERVRVAYAADVPAALHKAVGAPTTPGSPSTMLRWCTDGLESAVTMATLISPGAAKPSVEIAERRGRIVVSCRAGSWKKAVTLTRRLKAPR